MSKELVISANRHETRVAIVEDDQVVEVYHQRENEYSLAGSIHKGRVTRVLPGMQSAFVDIGLERDAFLYVSDFFEDNEEYDKIVTSVEEKVLKMDRTPAAAAAAAAPIAAVPVAETEVPPVAVAAEPVSVAEAAPTTAPAAAQTQAPLEQRRDDRDRRGRRGRRRRGQKGGGRGLPESKFYSPGGRGPAEPQAFTPSPEASETAAPVPRPPTAEDFFVLPGESLAKYSQSESEEFLADELETEESVTTERTAAGAEDEEPEEAASFESSADLAEAAEEPEPETAAPAAGQSHTRAAAARIEEPELAEQPGAVHVAAETDAEIAEELDVAATDAAEPLEAPEEEAEAPGEQAVEASPEAEELLAESLETDTEIVSEGETALAEEEGPEPARIPTSLTATLREQGPRYLHRVSRRMRRRNRGGAAEAPRPAAEAPVRAPVEQRVAPAAGNGRPERAPAPSIADLLKEGQEIIVQIAKEPLGQKGARITSHIALPGRFLVYMPTVDHIGVSRKIPSDEERSRLKRVLQTHRTGIPGGYIVRTAGEGHTEEELRADMMFLYNLWMDMRQKAERKKAPLLIHHDLNVVERVLRDQLTSSFKSIWVDNEELYESVLSFVQRFQPALVSRVKMYTRANPIFDEFGITAELEKALRPKVWLKSGGYIVINQTEALVAIDVNTGKFVGKSNRLEDTIVKTNTDAIKEIVRQIRLRDLGGIIVVDFIDMDERKNRQKVMQALEEAMRADRAPYKILQFNDFGLVAITRKRVKQSLERTLCVPCTYCEGAGYIKSPQTIVGEILQEAHKIAKAVEGKDVLLRVAPDVARLLKSNQNTYLQELEEILGRTVIVKGDPQLHQEKFDLA
jgi:ribonuclease G